MVENSLRFPMIYNTVPNSRRSMSYGCRNLDRSAETQIWAEPFGRSQEFDEDSP
jgi:hypothetical protein